MCAMSACDAKRSALGSGSKLASPVAAMSSHARTGLNQRATWRSCELRSTKRGDMRPVVLQMGVTVDGFVHGAAGYEDWGLPPEDEGIVAWKVKSLREAGTHIMGRLTYEAMAAVWPHTDGVYADVMNDIPKVVFSSSLTSANWAESRIASGRLERGRRPAQARTRRSDPRPWRRDLSSLADRRRADRRVPAGDPSGRDRSQCWPVQLAVRAAAARARGGPHVPHGYRDPRLPAQDRLKPAV